MKKVIRAALYARVSTSGHGQDVGLQLDVLRQVAAQRGWASVDARASHAGRAPCRLSATRRAAASG